jgi:hypothetical protein
LGTSSPDSKKSGYDRLPLAAPPADMRQFAPSTSDALASIKFVHFIETLTNKGLARNVATSVGEQIHSGIGDITDVTEATERLGLGIGFQSIRRE